MKRGTSTITLMCYDGVASQNEVEMSVFSSFQCISQSQVLQKVEMHYMAGRAKLSLARKYAKEKVEVGWEFSVFYSKYFNHQLS